MGALDVGSGPDPSAQRGLSGAWSAAATGRWLPGLVAAIGITIAVWGLMLPLTVALRGDELTSLFRYSSGGPSAIWGHYIPNDHMLYELLTWGLRELSGDRSVAVVRFWSVVPAIAAVVALTFWLWRRLDPWVAALFAVLVCAAPVFVDVSDEGRGYGLAILAAAVMLIGADWAARRRARAAVALFAVGAIVGIWTLPVFGLTFVAMAGLLLAKLGPRRDLIIAFAVVIVASLAFYAPVFGDLVKASGQRDGQQLSAPGFITGPLRDQLQPSVQALIHPLTALRTNAFIAHVLSNRLAPSVFSADLLAAILVVLGTIVLLVAVERYLAAALLFPAILSYLVLEIFRSYVISRFASFLLPGLLILIATGLVGAARAVAGTRALSALVVAAGLALSLFVAGKGYRLATLNGRPQAEVLVSNQPAAFADYLSPSAVSAVSAAQLQSLACATRRPFVLLDYELAPVSTQTAICLQHRPVATVATLALRSSHGSVPAIVLSVPGVF